MQFDVDPEGNPNVSNWPALRDQLSLIREILYCGLSASGNGVWGIINVNDPTRYKEHFESLKKDFLSFGIVLDRSKGGNPTDLRYYSYDQDAYIADEYSVYCNLPTPLVKRKKRAFKPTDITDSHKFEIAMRYCRKKGLHFVDGQKHSFLLTFARVCQKQGLSKEDVENFISTQLMNLNDIKSNCVDYPFKDQNKR